MLEFKVEGAEGLKELGTEMVENIREAARLSIRRGSLLFEGGIKQYLYAQKGFSEGIWKQLADSTVESKSRRGLSNNALIGTSSMARSIERVLGEDDIMAMVGTKQVSSSGARYPLIHEGAIKTKHVPARPFFWPAIQWRLPAFYAIVEELFDKGFSK